MVVGDYDLEPELRRPVHFVRGGDAAVDRQNEAVALFGDALKRGVREAVALLEATRKVPADVGAELPQTDDGERRRADPVDVVIAVHADPCAGRDRSLNRAAGALDVAE